MSRSLPTTRYVLIGIVAIILSLFGAYAFATRNFLLLSAAGVVPIALIALRYPFFAYLMLIATTWLDSINPFILASGLTLNRLLVAVMLASILMRSLNFSQRKKLTLSPFEIFSAIFLVTAALSVVLNGIGIRTIYQFSGFAIGFFYYWLAVQLIDTPRKLEWVMIVMVVGSIIIAVSVLVDAYTNPIGIRYSGIQSLEDAGSQTAISMPILIYLLTKRRSTPLLLLGILLVGVFFMAVLLTGSRAPLFALVAILVTLLVFLPMKTKIALSLTVVVIAVGGIQIALAINPNFESRFAFLVSGDLSISSVTSEDISFAAREQVYERALLAFQTSPVYGIGYGNLQDWNGFTRSSHSVFLNVLGEQGLLGFASLMLMYGYLVLLYIKQIRSLKTPTEKLQRTLLFGTLIGYDIVIASFSISTLQRLMFLYFAFPVVMEFLDKQQQPSAELNSPTVLKQIESSALSFND